ncbi:MAG: response regulator, partial [Magnetococcales bacterium]|nr:response regulator [Magnetococcales bacterium]
MNNNNASKPIILVVDDIPENIDVLKGALMRDYTVRPAPNGLIALKAAHISPHPDLVLLDIMMPEMNGYEVCRRLKADEVTQHIPVIFVSAKSEEEDELEGLRLGAVDYITKPFQPEEVLVRIGTHLSLRLAHRQLEESRALLEERVKERTAELEKANQAKSDFLATMSHEIRTPMHAILGMSDILLETRLDDSQRSYVTMFQKAGRNLLNLINDILDLSKVESGQLG